MNTIDNANTELTYIRDLIESVTKTCYWCGKYHGTHEYTAQAYVDEWAGLLYTRFVGNVKGTRLTHGSHSHIRYKFLTRYEDRGEKVRWDYEIHWKS